MPEVGFDPENKSSSIFDMDQLRLKMREKTRILVLDQRARMLAAHWIITGPPQEKGGRPRGGYYTCLGDMDKITDGGVDAEKCPSCAIASPEGIVSMPRRRFALNIAHYRTNGKGEVLKPISLAQKVWVFGDDKFNRLVDRSQEHGDLRKKDLIVTCTAEMYQNMDIDVGSAKPVMTTDEGAIEQWKDLLESRPEDIERLLARTVTYEALELLLSDTDEASEEETLDDTEMASITDEIANELAAESGDGDEGEKEAVAAESGAVDFDDLLKDD